MALTLGLNSFVSEQPPYNLLDRRVDGILYAADYHRLVDLPPNLEGIPALLINSRSVDRRVTSVAPDELGGALAAVRELTANGHRRVGYLPGGIALYDGMAGVDLLDYLGQLYGRKPVRRAELLDRLELSERTLRRPVRDYSRGMRQKIGIVQALQHDPELAILDEPTEGLDPLMQRAFYDILDELRAAGRTIFFSAHVLSGGRSSGPDVSSRSRT